MSGNRSFSDGEALKLAASSCLGGWSGVDLVCFAGGVLDTHALDWFVELARSRLAAGLTHDDLLGELRRHGLEKIDCIRVVHTATGASLGDAKLLVHHSPVWADRREGDEYLEDSFWRATFILCVVGNGRVNEPGEWAAECLERQQRAAGQLQEVAKALPEVALTGYHRCMDGKQLGKAFAALVVAGRRYRLPHHYWRQMASVAETLCLNELLDDVEPTVDETDFVYAAHVVRRLANASD